MGIDSACTSIVNATYTRREKERERGRGSSNRVIISLANRKEKKRKKKDKMIIGVKSLKCGNHKERKVTELMEEALRGACSDTNVSLLIIISFLNILIILNYFNTSNKCMCIKTIIIM